MDWRVSSRCDGGACVEVAAPGLAVLVRDSTAPGTVLAVSAEALAALVCRVKAGDG